MRKKALAQKNRKEQIRFLAVVVFFLVSGILYSHSYYHGALDMGTEITADKIGIVSEETVSAEQVMEKIDINTALQEELMLLPDIGEKRAADIIKYRDKNGVFGHIEDIMKVSGIGEKTFEEIKERITVGE